MNSTTLPRRIGGRLSMAASAWTLVLLLLSPMACSGAAPAGIDEIVSAPEGDLIAMLPAQATVVGFVDVRTLLGSPLYQFAQEHSGAFTDAEQFERIVAETGIDPRRDLQQVAFVSRGSGLDDSADASAVLVMASFDRARITEKLAGATPSQEYGGYSLYELASWRFKDHDEAEGDVDEQSDEDAHEQGAEADDDADDADLDRGFALILDDSTLAFGGEQMLHEIIDVAGGAASARDNDQLMGLLEDVDPDSQLWVVTAQHGIFEQLRADRQDLPQIPINRIESLIVSGHLTEGISLVVRGRTEREDDAKLLGDSLNGMLAFGKMMLQSSSPEVFEILDRGVTAGSNGFDVTVRAQLTAEDVEALYAYARQTMGGDDTEA